MTTSKRVVERKSARFQGNIARRGSVPETVAKKGDKYPVSTILGSFASAPYLPCLAFFFILTHQLPSPLPSSMPQFLCALSRIHLTSRCSYFPFPCSSLPNHP
ncbi:unnamed protein product [Closterium sp. Naga37s-1]|nr:unnamed protein product [Closterium sp. Naga37s-1]